MKQSLFLLLFVGCQCVLYGQGRLLSFEEVLRQMKQNNRSLKIAAKNVEVARAERDKLRAAWYPSLQSYGTFVHLSEAIEVRQSLSTLTEPAKAWVQEWLPDDQLITGILNEVGRQTLAFPLTPRNLTDIGLNAEWVLFSGGERIRASRIGERLVETAREAQWIALVESYFGLRLAQEVVQVRRETFRSLTYHYNNALKLEAVGMIDKAGRLFAQVNKDEAQRELEAAQKDIGVLQRALLSVMGQSDDSRMESDSIFSTTPLFIHWELPDKEIFRQLLQMDNPNLNQLRLQEEIAHHQLRIEQSGYLPDIALFGKQTLYSHGIASNLMPRTMIGIGFTWNLFDGTAREQRIRQAKLTRQNLVLGKEKVSEDLYVALDKLYTQLQKAQENVRTLNETIALNEELVRIRSKSFAEGMATGSDVVDAETMLAAVRVARLSAYYEYDVAIIHLLALCGIPEKFQSYPKQ